MSELTHINCVALTARFPVGKPVVPAALMNRPTRGERRFAYWGVGEELQHEIPALEDHPAGVPENDSEAQPFIEGGGGIEIS